MIRTRPFSLALALAVALGTIVTAGCSSDDRQAPRSLVRTDLEYVPNGSPAQRLDLYLPVTAAPGSTTSSATTSSAPGSAGTGSAGTGSAGTGSAGTGSAGATTGSGFPLVIFIHGGKWAEGDKSALSKDKNLKLDVFRDLLIGHGYAVASLNYRLVGEAKYPAQIHDVKAATRYLRANAASLGLDPGRFAVSGESSGGHLALLTGLSHGVAALEGTLGNTGTSSAVQAVVSYYGISDLRTRGAQKVARGCPVVAGHSPSKSENDLFGVAVETPAGARLAAQASPVSYLDRTDPPVLLFHGRKDCNVPVEQSEQMQASLTAAGVHAELSLIDAAHAQPQFYATPALQQQLLRFLDAALARTATGSPSP